MLSAEYKADGGVQKNNIQQGFLQQIRNFNEERLGWRFFFPLFQTLQHRVFD